MLDKAKFFSSIGELQIQFGYLLPDRVLKIYWKYLSRLSEDQWDTACEQVVVSFHPTTACPFPTIAHFWELRKRNIEILGPKLGKECDDGYIGAGQPLLDLLDPTPEPEDEPDEQ